MKATIVSVGTELASGQCIDTNSAWIAARLTGAGVQVSHHVTVGDDQADLADAVCSALHSCQLVIITGGLGPTLDDLTREALAEALESPLAEDAEALRQVEAFFARWQRPMPESNRRQAMIPGGCGVIPNPRGTAPGIHYTCGDTHLFALPGVPGEMKLMFEQSVTPVLAKAAAGRCTFLRRLSCFGIPEAKLGDILADMMVRDRNPLVGTTASEAVLSVRILATGADEAEARRLLDADAAAVGERLGAFIFGEEEETLQDAVAKLLIQQRKTVATAESCTGGLLAKCLTDIAGSSAYFLRGFITYSNEAKVQDLGVPADIIAAHGAVSEEVAKALAEGCRRRTGSDFALSITGIAGPSGGSPEKPVGLVYIALASDEPCEVKRVLLGDHLTRNEVRDRACKAALNMLRLRLIDSIPKQSC